MRTTTYKFKWVFYSYSSSVRREGELEFHDLAHFHEEIGNIRKRMIWEREKYEVIHDDPPGIQFKAFLARVETEETELHFSYNDWVEHHWENVVDGRGGDVDREALLADPPLLSSFDEEAFPAFLQNEAEIMEMD